MKKIKRILPITLLILVVLGIGYMVKTYNRISKQSQDIEEYKAVLFVSEDNSISLYIDENTNAKYMYNGYTTSLQLKENTDGVLVLSHYDMEYRFVVIDSKNLYDCMLDKVLYRGGNI